MSLGAIIDVVQTVAIIALTVVVAFSMRGVDRQFKTLRCDVHDAIASQYAILDQIKELETQTDTLAERVDRLESA